MEADDFLDLYKLIRGNRAATAVTDARALFMEKKIEEAYEKLLFAQETFVESRSRTIKQDVSKQVDPKAKDAEKQIKKLQRKQDKVLDGVKKFEELMPQLEKLVKREREKQEKLERAKPAPEKEAVQPTASLQPEIVEETIDEQSQEPSVDSDSVDRTQEDSRKSESFEIARPSDVSDQFIAALQESDGETQLDVIDASFNFREVRSEEDIHSDALYYIRTSASGFVVRTPGSKEMTESIALVTIGDDRPIKPFKRRKFLKLGTSRKMVLLTRKETSSGDQPDAEITDQPATDQPATDQPAIDQPVGDESDENSSASNIIDMAAFSQLLTAAQRSGLVSGADQIGHIRDREFQQGKFDLAFQSMDSIYSRFSANANQRAQRLRQEDADIASGRLKISPKDLLAKRARDRAQTQEVDRAQRRFQVVIEGLRVLMKTS